MFGSPRFGGSYQSVTPESDILSYTPATQPFVIMILAVEKKINRSVEALFDEIHGIMIQKESFHLHDTRGDPKRGRRNSVR